MNKKSITTKIKSLAFPLAFILIAALSAVYKLVLKGSGDFSLQAFKSGKTAQVIESSVESNIALDVQSTTEASIVTVETTEPVPVVSVYICGEVNAPGIYEAPQGTLLNDIITDAGGLTEEASAENINFVYVITCNMSIYIPSATEIKDGYNGGDIIRSDGVFVWGNSGTASGSSDSGSKTNLMVNINTATVEELTELPGIGEVTAQAIVDYRENTPFRSIEDIKNVSGIGDSKFSKIKDHICV